MNAHRVNQFPFHSFILCDVGKMVQLGNGAFVVSAGIRPEGNNAA
jgi:hypothetical protein